jgi:hypothetical protein
MQHAGAPLVTLSPKVSTLANVQPWGVKAYLLHTPAVSELSHDCYLWCAVLPLVRCVTFGALCYLWCAVLQLRCTTLRLRHSTSNC